MILMMIMKNLMDGVKLNYHQWNMLNGNPANQRVRPTRDRWELAFKKVDISNEFDNIFQDLFRL